MEDCDRDGNGVISIDELHKAVTQGSLAFSVMLDEVSGKKSDNRADECSREQLLQFMVYQFNKDDACFSLPFTILFFAVFILLVQIHFRIDDMFWLHEGIDNEVSGEGGRDNDVGPFLMRDVHDIPTVWLWIEQSMASALFRQDLHAYPVPGRIAHFNQLVGGVALIKHEVPEVPCDQQEWLREVYDNEKGGVCYDSTGPVSESVEYFAYQQKLEEIRERMSKLQEESWLTRA
jgi:hypothetical protein